MKNQGVATSDIDNVAVRILAEQNKLGKLQSLNLSVRSISELKRKRMIQSGVLGVALLAAGGFMALGVKKDNEKSKKRAAERVKRSTEDDAEFRRMQKDLNDLLEKSSKTRRTRKIKSIKASNRTSGGEVKRTSDAEFRRMERDFDDRLKSESWNPVEEAFFEKKLTIYVEARYKYGTKVFEVFSATPEVIKSSQLDKKIFNEVKTSVNRMKNNGFSVREDLTLEAYKEIKLANSLLEDMNFLL